MPYRKLRIAWSVMWGALCMLFVVLWVRSNWTLDRVRVGKTAIASLGGRLLVNDVFNISQSQPELMQTYSQYVFANDQISIWTARRGALIPVGVGRSMPLWPFVLAAAAMAPVSWIRGRFSLRTLLIVTTILAVVFGFVFATR